MTLLSPFNIWTDFLFISVFSNIHRGFQWSHFYMSDRKQNPVSRLRPPPQPHPLSPNKVKLALLLCYCAEIVSFNLLINCRIVLRTKRLASAASLQRSDLQPVHARARAHTHTHVGLLAEKDGCRCSASVKGPTCEDMEGGSFNIRSCLSPLPLMK